MNCLYLTQELAPHFAEGGLGLNASGQPAAVHKQFGITYTIMLPFYRKLMDLSGFRVKDVTRVPGIRLRGRMQEARLYKVLDSNLPFEILLVRNDHFYDRQGIYRDHNYVEYEDAVVRAIFFGHCVGWWVSTNVKRFMWVHGNDWQSGMALRLIRNFRSENGFVRPALIFQIHNALYRGDIDAHTIDSVGEGYGLRQLLEPFRKIRATLLLLGAQAADVVLTLSHSYALELCTASTYSPLAKVMKRVGVVGITSGIDQKMWDPSRLTEPSYPFTSHTVREGKRINKRRLQELLDLDIQPNLPIFMVCSRLIKEKGMDLVLEGLRKLFRHGQFECVLMGRGDARYSQAFARLESEHRKRLRYRPGFDMQLAQLMYAGCDFTLMPSLSEPCGLNQLIAMKFGTLPIVTQVGGLKDTVVDLRSNGSKGNGFFLQTPSSAELVRVANWCMKWWSDNSAAVDNVRRRSMELDWSWERVAADYARVYELAGTRQHARTST